MPLNLRRDTCTVKKKNKAFALDRLCTQFAAHFPATCKYLTFLPSYRSKTNIRTILAQILEYLSCPTN